MEGLLERGDVDATDDCWVWNGTCWEKGYGRLGDKRAHRVMWAIVNGPIPPGLQVLHHCDNPPCVRPEHLFLGTQLDNMRDMIAKGRKVVVKGAAHPSKRPEYRAAMSGDKHWSKQHPERVASGDRHWSRTQPEHFDETFIAARDRALGRDT
jgi:hypothetical protein